tara:strand:- start:2294 stop:2950 length:657 start_codon:yes stop_codon:yes gene_type:complete
MEFSSTQTYANRYDLDEIDVFLEGDSSNPMFFSVTGIDKQFNFGKHYFNLSLLNSNNQKYKLRENSRILFEFKSINNVVLKSDVVNVNQKNGVANCFFEVLKNPLRTFKDVEDGFGTLTLAGSLENKSNTQNLIPQKYLGAMNYRCTFPIEIRKNLINSQAPISTNVTHEVRTTLGRFSFVKGSVSPPAGATRGYKYNTDGIVVTSNAGQPFFRKSGS